MKTKTLLFLAVIMVSCSSGQKSVDYVSIDQKMNDSINVITLKINGIYYQVEEIYSKSPELSGKYRTSALQVKERADEMFNYLQDLKLSMITMTDGEDSPAINGKEIDMAKVSRLNNNTIPSNIMIGRDEDGRAYDVKAIITSFISFLNEEILDDQITRDKINSAIDFSDHKSAGTKKEETDESWPVYTFKGKTLGETINTLSRLQFETKKLESETLSFLNSKINAMN